ncbi:MAG: MSHA biogenesis protein MshI [Candidatus Azotimanducaceae bacterium]
MKRLFKKSIPGSLGLEVSPFGVAAAYLFKDKAGDKDEVICRYFEGSIENSRDELEKWIVALGDQRVEAQVVLHPTMYSVYFVDRPEVEDAELSDAVRWKIKDLVDAPLKDLIVDAFVVPEDAYRGNQKKVYAFATDKSLLEDIVAQLRELPITLLGITISELADLALLNRLHDDRGGVALLRLRSANGTINLIDGGDLYLTRSIDSGVSALETATEENRQQVMDQLLLDVQRCLDFYDSQLGKGAIRNIFLAPTRLNQNFFDEHLRGHLDLSVHPLDLNDSFSFKEPLTGDLQSICFGAVAAACDGSLREGRIA